MTDSTIRRMVNERDRGFSAAVVVPLDAAAGAGAEDAARAAT